MLIQASTYEGVRLRLPGAPRTACPAGAAARAGDLKAHVGHPARGGGGAARQHLPGKHPGPCRAVRHACPARALPSAGTRQNCFQFPLLALLLALFGGWPCLLLSWTVFVVICCLWRAGPRVLWRPSHWDRGMGLRLPAKRRLLAGTQGGGARKGLSLQWMGFLQRPPSSVPCFPPTPDLLLWFCRRWPPAVQSAHLHPSPG